MGSLQGMPCTTSGVDSFPSPHPHAAPHRQARSVPHPLYEMCTDVTVEKGRASAFICCAVQMNTRPLYKMCSRLASAEKSMLSTLMCCAVQMMPHPS